MKRSLLRAKTGTNTRDKGNLAEQIAAHHLQDLGYRVVEQNFACKLGEIDIVAQHGGDLVFVEVRSRGSASALNPVFSVNRQKQQRIIRAAKVYLEKRYREVPPARFDVAIVTMSEPAVVEIIRDAFSADYY